MATLKELKDFHEAMNLLEEKRSVQRNATSFNIFYKNEYEEEPKTLKIKEDYLKKLTLKETCDLLEKCPSGGYRSFFEGGEYNKEKHLYEKEINDAIFCKKNENV